MNVGDHVTLPVGTKIGMGRLRVAVTARIDQIQTASDGSPFYGVSWTDPKTGKRRTTWWAPPANESGLTESTRSKTMGFKYAVRSNVRSTVRDSQGMSIGWMEAYVYAADIYCEDCGRSLQNDLPEYEESDDSGDYPQGPYPDGGGESDSPQHCGSGAGCVNAMEFAGTKVGVWLGNPLTTDGVESLKEMLSNPDPNEYQLALHEFWGDVYSDYLGEPSVRMEATAKWVRPSPTEIFANGKPGSSRGSLWTINYRALWPNGRGVWRVAVVRAMSAAEALAKLRARERERLTNVTIEPGHNVPGYPTSAIIHEASHELLRESVNGTWYHGSPTRFERFHRRVAPTFGTGASEVPIFLTQDIDFAQLHAGPNGFIYTVRPHVKRTFDATTFVLDEKYWPPPRDALNSDGQAFYDDLVDNHIFPQLIRYGTKHEAEDEWDTMHDSNGTYASILARQYDVMETTEMKRWMLVHDYDSFFVRGDGPKNNLAVFDPSKVEILSTDPSK